MRVVGLIFAASLSIGFGWSAPAMASDYGCQVLLCLSNPTGSMAYTECVPPIEKLFEDLALGRSFPMCDLGGAVRSKVSGRPGSSGYGVTMYFDDGSQQRYSLSGNNQYEQPVTPGRRLPPGEAEQ